MWAKSDHPQARKIGAQGAKLKVWNMSLQPRTVGKEGGWRREWKLVSVISGRNNSNNGRMYNLPYWSIWIKMAESGDCYLLSADIL